MREMYEQTLPPQFLYLFILLITTLDTHHHQMKLLIASFMTLSLCSPSLQHAPYHFKGDLSSMQTHQLSIACRINPLRWHICLSLLDVAHCPEKVTHLQSSVYTILFVRNTDFLGGRYCYHPSSAPSPMFPLYCYPQYSYWYVCPSSIKVRAGSHSFFLGGGGCLFYSRVATNPHLYLLIVLKSYL